MYKRQGIGYGSILYLAAIMGIDTSIYESASIDGANVFQRIFHVTIPMITVSYTHLDVYKRQDLCWPD